MNKVTININKKKILKQCPYFGNGAIFAYKPLRDVCFIWPFPLPTTLGKKGIIEIPIQHRNNHKNSYGILLAIGPGWTDNKGKYHQTQPDLYPGCFVMYDNTVPWKIIEKIDDQKIKIIMCGEGDIKGIIK